MARWRRSNRSASRSRAEVAGCFSADSVRAAMCSEHDVHSHRVHSVTTPSRREFVKSAAVAASAAALLPSASSGATLHRLGAALERESAEEHGWARVPSILARIEAPAFPSRLFPVTRYGAKPDGAT